MSRRFDAAHELGHLVLHRHGGPRGRETEQEADAFASTFLMPRSSVLAQPFRLPTVDSLIKKVWSVSGDALAHRLHELGIVTDWHYRTLCIEISQRGLPRAEPDGIAHESSQVLAKVFSALKQEGLTKSDVAKDLRIYHSDIDSLIFGLVLAQVGKSSGSSQTKKSTVRLHLF